MIKSFRVKLYPDKNQVEKIIKFCNAARYAYNWAIALEEENYKNGGKFISGYVLTTMFTQFKKQPENEWLKEISGRATKIAILNAAQAYENFFKKHAKHPKFKSKKRSKMSCATHEGTILVENNRVRLEKLGWVKLGQRNYIPFGENIKYLNPKIEYDNVNFWLSVAIDVGENPPNDTKPKSLGIGIDLGLKTLAICSNGIELHKPNISKLQKKLKRIQRRASRYYQVMINESNKTKTKFDTLQKSHNLIKIEKEINAIYQKINNVLTTNIHQFTTGLVKSNPEFICLEDLNVAGMRKNKHLSRKINESKFAEIRRQLEYKCNWNNVPLVIADRWYPSSKTCSNCGCIKDKLSLSERTYICGDCGCVIDRDMNAAINLMGYGKFQLKLA
jgi:putative transposase